MMQITVSITEREAEVLIEALHEYMNQLIGLDLEPQAEIESAADKINTAFQRHRDAIRGSAAFLQAQLRVVE